MKIVSLVGARPEFIQAAPLSRVLRREHHEILVHTGQHYDASLSQTFFDELDLPAPKYNLDAGSGTHTQQTTKAMLRFEEVLQREKPDLVIVRGDTNSTLAGGIVASKLQIPLAHVEAGERSFNRRMPEEINRLVVDQLADVHFCVSRKAVDQLAAEGIRDSAYWVGDVLLDAMIQYRPKAHRRMEIFRRLDLQPGGYSLVTVHRAGNTEDVSRLGQIARALEKADERIVFPVHPRTARALADMNFKFGRHVNVIEPVGYLEMILLEEQARMIATDSGGVQREAYFLGVPCLTLRDETEWIETVEAGWNKVVGADPGRILSAWGSFVPPVERPAIFGDGMASERIGGILSGGDLRRGALEPVSRSVAAPWFVDAGGES
jgi:UDP-N-acetylglucosamine 2-epimerase